MTNVLFVCTGNTCRSPMAEAILKNMNIDGIEVKSRGIFAFDGQDASPNAKQVLKENQISHNHQSKLFSSDDTSWADYILTMTAQHKDTILRQYPHLSNKVFTLNEFVGEHNKDISDPYGSSVETYRKTFEELESIIKKLAQKLQSE